MVIGKIVTKFIQSLPSWEVTKYYGRVCIYQLRCWKYRVQTSEAWFNFKCKFMPGSLRDEAECEECVQKKIKNDHLPKQQKVQGKKMAHPREDKQQRRMKNANCESSSSSFENLDKSCMPEEHTMTERNCPENQEYIPKDCAKENQRKAKRAQR